MLAVGFFSWWYGAGWRLVFRNVQKRLSKTIATFSVPTLSRTLFSPWRRIVAAPGAGIEAQFRAMGDNLVSRAVGFTVRLFVLVAALISLTVITIVSLVQIVVWPFIPPAIVVTFVVGLL